MDVLRSLGSLAEMSEEGRKIIIRGNGCPISRVVETDERSCAAMEAFLSKLTGLSVTEHCDHGDHPSCRFEIDAPASERRKS
jgi:predicted ArsR family transcriptional regulator